MNFPMDNPREIRRQTGLNQQEFWSRIGVTQSGGSRYESGRSMPRPVQELLRIVHLEQIPLEDLSGEDLRVLRFLKEYKPNCSRPCEKQPMNAYILAPLLLCAYRFAKSDPTAVPHPALDAEFHFQALSSDPRCQGLHPVSICC